MTVPTKRIEEEEFMELMKPEGDVIVKYVLTNVPFHPPLPNGERHRAVKVQSMNILMMNTTEPLIYKDERSGQVFVIINGYDEENTITYENLQDIHLIKNAWAYRLAPSWWDASDPNDGLNELWYVFKHEEREGQGLDEI